MKSSLRQTLLKLLARLGALLSPLFTKKINPQLVRRILVFQAGGIGDVIRVFPAILLLHQAFPCASLTVLSSVSPELFHLLPDPDCITELILFDLSKKHKGLTGKLRLVRQLKKHSFDLIFNLSRGEGMMENAVISFLSGSPYRVGFNQKGLSFLNTIEVNLRTDQDIISQNMGLVRALGIPASLPQPYLKVPESSHSFWHNFCNRYNLTDQDILIAVSPLSKWQKSFISWPLDKYWKLINQLLHSYSAHVVILGDKVTADQLVPLMGLYAHPRLINLAGQTTISEVAALISYCQLFIGNDSGLVYMAEALQISTIAIFGSTLPQQSISLNDHCRIVSQHLPCQPCYTYHPFQNPQCTHRKCLELIQVEQVMQVVGEIIGPPNPKFEYSTA